MKKVLFISNITTNITSFSSSALLATKRMGMSFIHAANWNGIDAEQRKRIECDYGIDIINVPINRSPFSLSNIKAFKQLCRFIRENNVDYIHCNTPVGGLLGRLVGKKCGVKKVIYQAHGFHFYNGAPKKNWVLFYPVEKYLAHFTDTLITINQEDYKRAQRFHLRNNGKVFYIPGVGINLFDFNNIDHCREQKRSELNLKHDDLAIISVGELNRNKNCSIIISALSQLKDPHIHYFLCGTGPEKDKLQELAKRCGLDNNIHLLNYRTDVKELLAASDIFVMPSFREGLPRSIMEAMASGKPCIVSRVRGNVDLIQDGKGGFLCNPNNASEFANAIRKLTLETRRKMSEYNRERIKQFDIHIVEDKLYHIYKELFT